jgi:RNA polymerase sigma factor (sigma-70 family)
MPTSQASIQYLAELCRQESKRSIAAGSDPAGACFELFRRAIVDGCQDAWQAVYAQYRRLVLYWVNGGADDREDLAQLALEKFIRAVTPEVFGRFNGIDKLLAFLKRCARSALIDKNRRTEREERALRMLGSYDPPHTVSSEQEALNRVHGEQCAERVYARLRDDLERRVIYLSFELDLKPSEIARRYPADFPTAHYVSRIKERVLRRLAQDPILQAGYGA